MTHETKPFELLTCDEMETLDMPVSEMILRLEDDLGPEAVWKLCGAYGGISIWIPKKDNLKTSALKERIAPEIAAWLVEHYSPGHLLIPMGPYSKSAIDMSMTRLHLLDGKTLQDIARRIGSPVRSVARNAHRLRTVGFV